MPLPSFLLCFPCMPLKSKETGHQHSPAATTSASQPIDSTMNLREVSGNTHNIISSPPTLTKSPSKSILITGEESVRRRSLRAASKDMPIDSNGMPKNISFGKVIEITHTQTIDPKTGETVEKPSLKRVSTVDRIEEEKYSKELEFRCELKKEKRLSQSLDTSYSNPSHLDESELTRSSREEEESHLHRSLRRPSTPSSKKSSEDIIFF